MVILAVVCMALAVDGNVHVVSLWIALPAFACAAVLLVNVCMIRAPRIEQTPSDSFGNVQPRRHKWNWKDQLTEASGVSAGDDSKSAERNGFPQVPMTIRRRSVSPEIRCGCLKGGSAPFGAP